MADNTTLNTGTGGDVIASDDIGGVKYQRVKLIHGADGVNSGDVSNVNPFPTTVTSALPAGTNTIGNVLVTPDVGVVSTVNSSTSVLGSSGIFTGTSENVLQYSTIIVTVFADQASATDGLSMQQSDNGTNWDNIDTYTIPVSTGKTFSLDRVKQFFRVVYTNSAAVQTAFRLTTIYNRNGIKGSSVRPQDSRTNDSDMTESAVYNSVFNGTSWDRLRGDVTNGAFVQVKSALPIGANTIGNVNINGTVPVTGTFFQATQPVSLTTLPTLAAGTNVIGNVGITAGTNSIGTVQPPAITKGTQGAVGMTTQDLKDAGRNPVHYYTVIPVLTSATDTLQSLTGTKAGVTVTATTTPAVVTAGKTLRVTRVAVTYIATATSGYGIVRLRFNTAGVVAITSPIAATIAVGAGTPATANSTGVEEASLSEGWEFAAATGIGISVQGFTAVTATAVGYMFVSVTGYEY